MYHAAHMFSAKPLPRLGCRRGNTHCRRYCQWHSWRVISSVACAQQPLHQHGCRKRKTWLHNFGIAKPQTIRRLHACCTDVSTATHIAARAHVSQRLAHTPASYDGERLQPHSSSSASSWQAWWIRWDICNMYLTGYFGH
jgi:hypothetical protein